jgi:plastocyanin
MAFTNEPSSRTESSGNVVGTAVRCGAAVAILVSGLVHLQLYFDGYRDRADVPRVGDAFLANVIASVVIAGLLAIRRDILVRLAGAGLLVATLIGFWLGRTDNEIIGLVERGLEPSPQAALSLVVEIVGLLLLAATFVRAIGPGDNASAAVAVPVVAAALIVSVGGAALWARSPEQSEADPATSAPSDPPTQSTAPATTPTTASPPATTSPATDPVTTVATETTEATEATESTKPRRKRDRPPATTAPATTTPPTTTPPTTIPATTTPPTTPPTSASEVVTIRIVDFAFEPEMVEIPVGTTVEWVNEDSFTHTVDADDGSFASEDLDTGDRFSFQFTEPGTYICGIHPSMMGAIVVTG